MCLNLEVNDSWQYNLGIQDYMQKQKKIYFPANLTSLMVLLI